MREIMKRQTELGELSIGSTVLDPKSRHDIPKVLVGLQYIDMHRELRDEVFAMLQEVIPRHADGKKASDTLGRPGMEQWQSLALGVVRLGLDADYDRLQELANQHSTLRPMLGHADWHDQQTYEVQTLKDNLRLFTPEILERISTAVVRAGHALLTVMTFPGTPDHESHDRFPLPRPLPRAGEGRFVSRIRDFHINSTATWSMPKARLTRFGDAFSKAK